MIRAAALERRGPLASALDAGPHREDHGACHQQEEDESRPLGLAFLSAFLALLLLCKGLLSPLPLNGRLTRPQPLDQGVHTDQGLVLLRLSWSPRRSRPWGHLLDRLSPQQHRRNILAVASLEDSVHHHGILSLFDAARWNEHPQRMSFRRSVKRAE